LEEGDCEECEEHVKRFLFKERENGTGWLILAVAGQMTVIFNSKRDAINEALTKARSLGVDPEIAERVLTTLLAAVAKDINRSFPMHGAVMLRFAYLLGVAPAMPRLLADLRESIRLRAFIDGRRDPAVEKYVCPVVGETTERFRTDHPEWNVPPPEPGEFATNFGSTPTKSERIILRLLDIGFSATVAYYAAKWASASPALTSTFREPSEYLFGCVSVGGLLSLILFIAATTRLLNKCGLRVRSSWLFALFALNGMLINESAGRSKSFIGNATVVVFFAFLTWALSRPARNVAQKSLS
jgi:hypothetical protein